MLRYMFETKIIKRKSNESNYKNVYKMLFSFGYNHNSN